MPNFSFATRERELFAGVAAWIVEVIEEPPLREVGREKVEPGVLIGGIAGLLAVIRITRPKQRLSRFLKWLLGRRLKSIGAPRSSKYLTTGCIPRSMMKNVDISARPIPMKTAKVTFRGTDPGHGSKGLRFKCKLDRGHFKSCRSPKLYKHLRHGKHTVQVKAIDKAGNVSKAVKRRFKV